MNDCNGMGLKRGSFFLLGTIFIGFIVIIVSLGRFYCFRDSNAYNIKSFRTEISSKEGSCFCGASDNYCLCTPSLAIDAVILIQNTDDIIAKYPSLKRKLPRVQEVVLVERKEKPISKFAIVGGFVNIGETVENAVHREVKEETNLDVSDIELYRVYSDPNRDPRRHTVSLVYLCKTNDTAFIKAGDDAKNVQIVDLEIALQTMDFAFDHKVILSDILHALVKKSLLSG